MGGMKAQNTLSDIAMDIREQAAAYCESTKVPAVVVARRRPYGVPCRGGTAGGEISAQTVVAHGVANAVTGAPISDDTGFLFGSVTKVLTTTLVLQQVERGVFDLDERVVEYLPEFKLTTPGAAEKIRVRNLLTYTNGIDADLFLIDARGRDAPVRFVEAALREPSGRSARSRFQSGAPRPP